MATASNAEAFRFLSNVKRQSAPPRCHPITIVLMVLALGMVFIGLTMTIIAHWPGATTIGENPLKIAGPVLLAVGFVLVIIGVIAICCLNRMERTKWRKLVQTHIESRNQSQAANRSQVTDRPSFEIQGQNRPAVPPSDLSNPDHSSGKFGNGSDTGYNKGGRYANVGDDQADQSQFSSFDVSGQAGDEEEFIAEPKRPQKKRRPVPPPGAGGLSDTSADQSAFGTMITTTTTTTTTTTKRTGEDGKTSEEKSSKTTTKKSKQDILLDGGGGGGGDGDVRGGKSPATGRGGIQPSPSPGESRMLRVHVKAQPGASVHIHPSGSPSVQPRRAFSPSNTSGETDI